MQEQKPALACREDNYSTPIGTYAKAETLSKDRKTKEPNNSRDSSSRREVSSN
jgi:hypothetical protein